MKNKKGFTLVELLIVVAIIAILVAVAVPVLNGQLEKAKEATDLANIRNAYSELMIGLIDDDNATVPPVQLKQKQYDWQTDSAETSLKTLGTIAESPNDKPSGGGTCTVSWNAEGDTVLFTFDGEGGGETESDDSIVFPSKQDNLKGFAEKYAKLMKKYLDDGIVSSSNTTYDGTTISFVTNYDNNRNKIIEQMRNDGYDNDTISGVEALNRTTSDLYAYFDQSGNLIAYRYEYEEVISAYRKYNHHAIVYTKTGEVYDTTSNINPAQLIVEYYRENS